MSECRVSLFYVAEAGGNVVLERNMSNFVLSIQMEMTRFQDVHDVNTDIYLDASNSASWQTGSSIFLFKPTS